MQKLIILSAFVLSWNLSAGSSFPNGNFKGSGKFIENNGKIGEYTDSVEIKNGSEIKSDYDFGDRKFQFAFTAKFDENGFFKVLYSNFPVGTGYCMSVQCHYEAVLGTITIEETLTFYSNHLYRVGSKIQNGVLTAWEEDLALVE